MYEVFQLSNDAFYYLKDGEEPLVDDAIDEALAIEAMFPEGFDIFSYSPIGTTGYIEVTIGPKIKIMHKPQASATIKYTQPIGYDAEAVERNSKVYADSDEVQTLSKIYRSEIVWQNPEHTKLLAYAHRLDTGVRTLFGEFNVQVQSNGLKYFEKVYSKGTYTRLYLRHYTKAIK